MAIEIPRSSPSQPLRTVRFARADPNVAAASGRALARAGAQVTDTIAEIAENMIRARRGSDLSNVTTRAAKALNDLEFDINQPSQLERPQGDTSEFDPTEIVQDMRTRPQRFAEGAAAIRKQISDEIDDPIVRQNFQTDFDKRVLSKGTTIRNQALQREIQASIARLDQDLVDLAQSASTAANEVDRAQLVTQGRIAIETASQSLLINPIDAGKRERAFLSQISEAEARRLLTEDPDAAVTALSGSDRFSDLDPVARQRLLDTAVRRADSAAQERARAADRAESRAARSLRRQGNEVMKDLLALDAEDRLTMADVDRAKPFVTPSQFAAAIRLADPNNENVDDDRDALRDIQILMDNDPGEARRLAILHHRNGLLSNQTFRSFMGSADQAQRRGGPASAYRRARNFIKESLDVGPFVDDPAGRRRVAEAVRAFDDFVVSGDRNAKALFQRADEIVGEFGLVGVGQIFAGLPRIVFGNVPSDPSDLKAIESAIDMAENETVRQVRAGKLDESRARVEARKFKLWRQWLDQAKRRKNTPQLQQ